MLLFKAEHVPLILSGRKTQTRRTWRRPRVVVGSKHKLYTRLPIAGGKPFAVVEIEAVWQELLGSITYADVQAEGYDSRLDLFDAFRRIHGIKGSVAHLPVFAVKFFLIRTPLRTHTDASQDLTPEAAL